MGVSGWRFMRPPWVGHPVLTGAPEKLMAALQGGRSGQQSREALSANPQGHLQVGLLPSPEALSAVMSHRDFWLKLLLGVQSHQSS